MVRGAMLGVPTAQQRLLEQVKHRQDPVTLRSAAALGALANAHEHRAANPGLHLQFRFTTNAEVGRERPSPLPGGLRGIDAWELVRTGKMEAALEPVVVAAIRTLLSASPRPADVPEGTWEAFQGFVTSATAPELRAFIASFEWATVAPDATALRPQIRDLLRRGRLADTDEAADELYQRLFATVFTRLSERGLKRFTRADLDAVLARPALVAADRALVLSLSALHEALAGRVEDLERQMGALTSALQATSARVDAITAEAGVRADLVVRGALPPPSLEEPPLVAGASARPESLPQALPAEPRPLVLGIFGTHASGKTQFAVLAGRELGARRVWFRFPEPGVPEAAERLTAAVRILAGGGGGDWPAWCHAAAAAADVVVLDGLPQFREGDALGMLLLPFLRACLLAGRSAVLTSRVPLVTLGRTLPNDTFISAPVPPLTEREVGEVFLAHGAPEGALSEADLRLAHGVTRGAPLLVDAAARWLASRGWVFASDALGELFANTFAEPVSTETLRVLMDEVTDAASRNLLYRLTLVGDEFEREEFDLLAEVPPPVGARRERLATLVGSWIQPLGGERYILSPLVRVLGADDLDAETLRGCHLALAERIAARPKIDEWELGRAMGHFLGAGEHDTAGLTLLRGLHSLHLVVGRWPRGARLPAIARAWRSTPMPEQMSPGVRVYIRAYQTVLEHRTGGDSTVPRRQLEELLAASPAPDPWSVFSASVLLATTLVIEALTEAMPFVERLLTLWPEVRDSFRERADPGADLHVEDFFWFSAGGVRTPADLEAWLAMLRRLPAGMVAEAFAQVPGRQAAPVLASRPYVWAYEKPPTEQDWDTALAQLANVEAAARAVGARALIAAAIVSRIAALVDGRRDLATALAVAEPAMAEFAGEAEEGFQVAKAMAFGCLDAGRWDLAADWLRRADALPGRLHGRERVLVKLRLAQVVGAADPQAAVGLTEAAAALALRVPRNTLRPVEEVGMPTVGDWPDGDTPAVGTRPGDVLVPAAFGELALARWFAGDQQGAALAMVRVLQTLLDARADRHPLWVPQLVASGHVSGYLVSMLIDGEPPERDGGYAEPKRGMLISPSNALAEEYDPGKLPVLSVHVMYLADLAEDRAAAVAWAERAVAANKAAGLWWSAFPAMVRLVQRDLEHANFVGAIGHALDAVSVHLAHRDRLESTPVFAATPAPSEVLGPRKGVNWTAADAQAIGVAVLPGVLRVATLLLEDRGRGEAAAAALRDACLAEADASANPEVWRVAAELCEQIFVVPVGEETLLARAREFRDLGGDASYYLGVIAHVGASLDPGLSPERALWHQLHYSEYLHVRLWILGGIYPSVVVPFYERFWTHTFERARFRFRAPRLVAGEIDNALRSSAAVRAQRLLQVVADGLGIGLPDSVRQWISRG